MLPFSSSSSQSSSLSSSSQSLLLSSSSPHVIVNEGFVAAFAVHIASSLSLCHLVSSSSPPVVIVIDGIIVVTVSSLLSHHHPPCPLPLSSLMKALWQHWLHTSLCCRHRHVIIALLSLGLLLCRHLGHHVILVLVVPSPPIIVVSSSSSPHCRSPHCPLPTHHCH